MFITSPPPAGPADKQPGRSSCIVAGASGGSFPVAVAPPAFCLHKLDLAQHIDLSGD